jgi:hypothetical protein
MIIRTHHAQIVYTQAFSAKHFLNVDVLIDGSAERLALCTFHPEVRKVRHWSLQSIIVTCLGRVSDSGSAKDVAANFKCYRRAVSWGIVCFPNSRFVKLSENQAVNRRLPTAAARVRSQVTSCGIYGGQSVAGAGIVWVLRFLLPILIPPTSLRSSSSSSIVLGWYNRPISGRRTKWTQSHPTPRNKKKKKPTWEPATLRSWCIRGSCTETKHGYFSVFMLQNKTTFTYWYLPVWYTARSLFRNLKNSAFWLRFRV